MMDTEALRKKVIELAIQGKLTEQLPSDGDAESLYVQILDHKLQLVKEGKIKKDKALPDIVADEIPFEIPSNWKWVRIGDVTYNHGQKTPQNKFCYIDVGTLDNVNHKLNDNENVVEGKDAPSRAKKIVEEGDVLYSTVRPYLHNICVVDKEFSYEPIASTAFAVMHTYDDCLLNGYLFYWLLSEWFDKYANGDSSKGTLYPAIGEKDFFKGLIPLPPFEEQKRIILLIDEVVRITRDIDKLQEKYSNNLAVLKSKIIDAGIQGKLTEQLPEDGDAELLYVDVMSQKTRLIEEGKFKKDKTLSLISIDEIPYPIPDNWKWVRIGEMFNVGTGKTPLRSEARFYDNGTIPWVNSSLTSNRYIDKVETKITEYAMDKTKLRLYPEHTLIVAMYGEGKTRGQVSELLIPATTNQACAAIESYVYYAPMVEYVYYCFLANYVNLRNKAGGSNQPNLNVQKVKDFIFPLPPLKEQKRITGKIGELLNLVEDHTIVSGQRSY